MTLKGVKKSDLCVMSLLFLLIVYDRPPPAHACRCSPLTPHGSRWLVWFAVVSPRGGDSYLLDCPKHPRLLGGDPNDTVRRLEGRR